jgi:hypothetical protein
MVAAVLAVALFVRGGEVLTALAISETNSSAATVNITAVPPQATNIRCFDASDASLLTMGPVIGGGPLSLVAGTYKQIYCNATITNPNGVGDIQYIYGSVHRDDAPNYDTCAEDDRNCYVNNSCENFTTFNVTTIEARCNFFIWFNADNTSVSGNWTPNMTIHDYSAQQDFISVGNRTNFSMSTLLAIGVSPLLAFGNKKAGINMTNVGGTSGTPGGTDTACDSYCNHSSYNFGNIMIDINVNSSALTCSAGGNIPANFLRVNISYNSAYGESYALTSSIGDSAGPMHDFKLGQNNTPNVRNIDQPLPTQKYSFWGIGVPNGAQGNCQGTIHFAAVET